MTKRSDRDEALFEQFCEQNQCNEPFSPAEWADLKAVLEAPLPPRRNEATDAA